MNTTSIRRRDGFALPAAVFALVVVGVLVTGGFYLARQETRIGVANKYGTSAFYLAERGLGEVVETWDASVMNALADFSDTTITGFSSEGQWDVTVTKLPGRNYFLSSEGTISQGGAMLNGASRRIGLATKLVTAEIAPPAALTTQGNVSIRGGAEVTGLDTNPPEWGGLCAPAGDSKPGVLTDAGSTVSTSGGGTVNGDPFAWDDDPSITDETFTVFGDLTWDDLVALANVRLPGGNFNGTAPSFNADGTCNRADANNWGDPLNPGSACGTYFPIIHINGLARIQSAGVGQGVMLVEGDVDLRGSFLFHGIILSKGRFQTQGSGHRIMGGVMAQNADLDLEKLVGASIVQNSSCAVERALLLNDALTRVLPLAERAWVDLSNLTF